MPLHAGTCTHLPRRRGLALCGTPSLPHDKHYDVTPAWHGWHAIYYYASPHADARPIAAVYNNNAAARHWRENERRAQTIKLIAWTPTRNQEEARPPRPAPPLCVRALSVRLLAPFDKTKLIGGTIKPTTVPGCCITPPTKSPSRSPPPPPPPPPPPSSAASSSLQRRPHLGPHALVEHVQVVEVLAAADARAWDERMSCNDC